MGKEGSLDLTMFGSVEVILVRLFLFIYLTASKIVDAFDKIIQSCFWLLYQQKCHRYLST